MKSYKDYANYRKLEVDVPGLSSEMSNQLEELITEFEENHMDDVLKGGNGFVPRLRKLDIVIGVTVNAIILIYYVWALVS